MTAGSTLSSAAFVLKRQYSDRDVGDHALREHPTMKMMSKSPGMTGPAAGWFYAIKYSNPQGVSGTYASVVTSGSSGVQLVATRRKRYGIVTLDGEATLACKDKGALIDLVTTETDGIIDEVSDSMAFGLFSDGNGYLGICSSLNSNTTTLTIADNVRNFKYGMTVVSDDAIAGGSLNSGSTTITGLDYDAGTITMASAAAMTGYGANDYIFRIGDPGTIVDGFAVHLPLTAPALGSDSFRGIDRGNDVLALSGARVDDTASPIEVNAGRVAVKISQGTKKANTKGLVLVLNPINFYNVTQRLNAKVTYDGGGNNATVGFEGIDLATPAGVMRAISDPDCPTNRGYVLNLSTWYWKHLGEFVHFVRDDGGGIALRMITEDSIKADVRSMGNICCDLPGANGVFSI